ncbi:hypothetical protein FZEAL_8788, partial [Fusarium zealandicum]
SGGGDYDTTANEENIAGAIKHHLKQYGNQMRKQECLTLTRGGTWHSYLLVVPPNDFDESAYRGPDSKSKHCTGSAEGAAA